MIGITISGTAYAAILSMLPAGSIGETRIAPEGQYRIWLPRDVVERLRALRQSGESFSSVILRLAERGSFAVIAR
jgi:hypothetical protein